MASLITKICFGGIVTKCVQHHLPSLVCPTTFLTSSRRNISYGKEPLKRSKYGGRYTVTLLPGDGVGPELTEQVRRVFRYIGAPVTFEEVLLNYEASDDEYDNAILAMQRNSVALKGNIGTNFDQPGFKIRNLEFRTQLDLFANVVHCKSICGVKTRHKDVDIVVIRENTEGEYRQLEHEVVKGVVESLKIITEKKSLRIANYAFEFAVRNGRKKVTCVHKANIMKLSDGLFLDCCAEVAKDYPQIEFNAMIVDNCSMQMVSRPQQFDVVVLPNLYGNIITNISTALVGGAGLVAGVNINDAMAVFETGTRNTGEAIKGQNVANPAGMLLASADMLSYMGLGKYGKMVREGVYAVLSTEQWHTPDLGGDSTTSQVVDAILAEIQQNNSQ